MVGSGVAYRLAEAGVDVIILEADRVGGGTSGISFAWTNSHGKEPRDYHDLNVSGMKAHAALAGLPLHLQLLRLGRGLLLDGLLHLLWLEPRLFRWRRW